MSIVFLACNEGRGAFRPPKKVHLRSFCMANTPFITLSLHLIARIRSEDVRQWTRASLVSLGRPVPAPLCSADDLCRIFGSARQRAVAAANQATESLSVETRAHERPRCGPKPSRAKRLATVRSPSKATLLLAYIVATGVGVAREGVGCGSAVRGTAAAQRLGSPPMQASIKHWIPFHCLPLPLPTPLRCCEFSRISCRYKRVYLPPPPSPSASTRLAERSPRGAERRASKGKYLSRLNTSDQWQCAEPGLGRRGSGRQYRRGSRAAQHKARFGGKTQPLPSWSASIATRPGPGALASLP